MAAPHVGGGGARAGQPASQPASVPTLRGGWQAALYATSHWSTV